MARDGRQRSREPSLHLTAKGEAAVAASRVAGTQMQRPHELRHELHTLTVLAECKCGEIYDAGTVGGALSRLAEHCNEAEL